jgi:hypothetical protein
MILVPHRDLRFWFNTSAGLDTEDLRLPGVDDVASGNEVWVPRKIGAGGRSVGSLAGKYFNRGK